MGSIGAGPILATFALLLTALVMRLLASRWTSLSRLIGIPAATVMLFLGCYASNGMGLHILIGAYLTGLLFPRTLMKHLYPGAMETFVAFGLAPLMLGHSSYLVPRGGGFDVSALAFVLVLFAVTAFCKAGSVVLMPPTLSLTIRERLAVGSLLQCKGLLGIVAATTLCREGLLPETCYPHSLSPAEPRRFWPS